MTDWTWAWYVAVTLGLAGWIWACGAGARWLFDARLRRVLPSRFRLDRCENCGERSVLALVEKTGYEGWFCADCQEPPIECTCYEAVPGHMVGCPAKKR